MTNDKNTTKTQCNTTKTQMPTDTVKSLRKRNDNLQAQLQLLKNEFKNLESSLADREVQAASESNGGSHDNDDIELVKSLEFLSAGYDSLSAFQKEAKEQLQGLTKRLNSLVEQVGEIAEAIDAIDRYSYQYNVKIVGIPEVNSRESALDTSTLCVKLFEEMGVEVTLQDIDIAHRISTRSATSGPSPIICKFTRRLVKDRIMNRRREISSVSPNSLGLSTEASLSHAAIYDHLTPKIQKLLIDAKKFQEQHRYSFCWVKNCSVFLRKSATSRPVKINNHSELLRLADPLQSSSS